MGRIEDMELNRKMMIQTPQAERRVRFLSQNRPGSRMGMGHYERLLLNALERAEGSDRWSFEMMFSGRRRGPLTQSDTANDRMLTTKTLGFSPIRLANLPWWAARGAVGLSERGKADLYHSLALSFPAPRRKPAIYTIHDLPPARFQDEGHVPRWAKAAVRDAAAVHVPSAFAKAELVELLDLREQKVHVIPYGCESEVFHPAVEAASDAELERLGLRRPFLLYVGGFTRRKNLQAMLEAWKAAAPRWPEVQLALVGPQERLEAVVAANPAPRVNVPGYLGRDTLPSVLKAAEALVFPSIYEGFGMPPLEAMAMGVPVVAVRRGAVPEVVGDAGLLAEDGSSQALEAAIHRLLDDAELREALKQKGPQRAASFQWDKHASRMLQLYEEVLA